MAQFDVYRPPRGGHAPGLIFVLDIQASLLESLSTRMLVPLIKPDSLRRQAIHTLNPELVVLGQSVLMLTQQMASLPKRAISAPVDNLERERVKIIRAVDALLSGI